MAKSMKVKCSMSTLVLFFTENRLYKININDEGVATIRDDYKVRHVINLETMRIVGEDSFGAPLESRFVTLKAKTILCKFVDHKLPGKKAFKTGKRYQIESGRELGGVAGYVFDEQGDRWTLYREQVGFSAGGTYLFEAKYS